MKKKFIKGLYCVAMMLITLGMICLIPSIKNGGKTSSHSPSLDAATSSEMWASSMATSATDVLLSATVIKRPDGDFYQIGTAQQLAAVAYLVTVQGNATYASYNYELTDNIDLSGSLWTPIGTTANPFRGIFHGNRYKISGIHVTESSLFSQGGMNAGLFGYTAGATGKYAQITDLILDDFNYTASTSATVNAGTLLGSAGANTIIANVYDLSTNISVGATAGSSVYVYRGGSRDGVYTHYNTQSAVENTLRVMGSPTTGYAISYKLNGGKVYPGNYGLSENIKTWNDETSDSFPIYGSVINTDGTAGVSYGNYGALLTSRASAMKTGPGAYFAVKEGSAFALSQASITSSNISTLLSAGLFETLTWSTKNFTLNLDYGYNHSACLVDGTSENRTGTYSVPNDAKWSVKFPTLTRLGYILDGGAITTGYVGDEANLSGSTYSTTLTWDAKTNISYRVNLATVTSDVGFYPSSAVSGFEIYEGSGADKTALGVGNNLDSLGYLTNHDASKDVTIEFDLNAGYKFASAMDGNTSSSCGPTTTTSAFEADGVYMVATANDVDEYDKTNYTITKTGSHYTIVVRSVVGTVDINLAFDRIAYTLPLNGEGVEWFLSYVTNAKGESDSSKVYTKILDKSTLDLTDEELADGSKQYLTTRIGENFTIMGKAKDETIDSELTERYITNYSATGFGSTGVIIGAGVYAEHFEPANTYKDHYKAYTYTITGYERSGESSITIKARELLVKVNVSIVHENGEVSSEFLAVAQKTVAGTNSGANEQLTNGQTPVTFSANIVNNKILVYVYTNGYYQLAGEPIQVLKGNDEVSFATEPTLSGIITTGDRAGYVKQVYSFVGSIEDNVVGTPEYTVTFTVVPKTYTVTPKVAIKNGENFVDLEDDDPRLAKFFSSHGVESATANPGDATAFNFTLKDNKILHFVGYEVEKVLDPEIEEKAGLTPGEVGTIADNSYTFGTCDVILRAKYEYKNIEFNLEDEAYVVDVNGRNGINVLLADAGVTYKSGSSDVTSVRTIRDAADNLQMYSDLTKINIPEGYYFLGWYLKKDGVYSPLTSNENQNVAGLLTNEDILNMLANNDSEYLTLTLVPAIRQRTITLKFVVNGTDKDPYELESVKDSSKTSQYVYYFDQEKALFNKDSSGQPLEDSSADKRGKFSFAIMNGLLQKIASTQTGWHGEAGLTKIDVLTSGTFSTADAGLGDVWGEDKNFDLSFTPVWQTVKYTISIDESVTMEMAMGESIKFVAGQKGEEEEGAVKYVVVSANNNEEESEWIGLNSHPGETAVSFKFFGGEGTRYAITGSNIGKDASLVLTEENIKDYLSSAQYYVNRGIAFKVSTVREANVYKLYIMTTAPYEKLEAEGVLEDSTGKYITFTYGQNPTNLENVKISRDGYRLAKWVENLNESNIIAQVNGDVYTYSGAYKFNRDLFVKAVWESNKDYINIGLTNHTQDTTFYYIGQAQKVASVELSTDGNDEDLTAVLGSGDSIRAQYFLKVAGASVSDEIVASMIASDETNKIVGSDLMLTKVAESGYYIYVVEYYDNLNKNNYFTYTTPVNFNINKNTVAVKDYDLQGYYTGKAQILPTADNNFGSFVYGQQATDKVIEGITLNRVEVVATASGKFNVGTYNTVKYYLNISEELKENFTGIDNKSFEITVNNIAEIIAMPVNIKVSGEGFFIDNNILHNVYLDMAKDSANYSFAMGLNLEDFADVAGFDASLFNILDFNFGGNVKTISGEARVYTDETRVDGTSDFNLETLTATLNGDNIKSNFRFVVKGQYEIIQVEGNANLRVYDYSMGFLTSTTSENDLDVLSSAYNREDVSFQFNVVEVKVDGTRVYSKEEGKQFLSYIKDAKAVFTFSGNGSTNFKIAVNKGAAQVEFVVEVVDTIGTAQKLVFLGFQERQASVNGYADAFASVVDVNTSTINATDVDSSSLIALYSDLKQVVLDYNDNSHTANKTIYLKADDVSKKTINEPIWTGFEFSKWTPTDENLIIEEIAGGKNVTVGAAAGKYATASLTASWRLAEINAATNKTVIEDSTSDSAFDSSKLQITYDDIVASISNENTEDITYSYEWYKGVSKLGNDSPITLDKLMSSNGTGYKLVIKAKYKLDDSKTISKELPFEVRFTQSTIALKDSIEGLTFNGKVQTSSISLKVLVNDVEQVQTISLSDYLVSGNVVSAGKNFGLKLFYRETLDGTEREVSEIKNAGFYTIKIIVNSDVYAASTSTASITVDKFSYHITAEDNVRFSKSLGTSDPSLVKDVVVKTSEGTVIGSVKVTFEREDTSEEVNKYALSVKEWNDTVNYTIDIAEDDMNNDWFEIEPAKSDLYIQLVNSLTSVYNAKTATKVSVAFESGKWTLYVKDDSGYTLASSDLTLYYRANEGDTNLTLVPADLLDSAFGNITEGSLGVTFTIDANAKNVGGYEITASAVKGTNGFNYDGISSTGSIGLAYTVTAKAITVASVTKVFDGNNIFNKDNSQIVLAGIETGDEVYVNGTFADETFGEHDLTYSANLTGTHAGNYTFDAEGSAKKGNITALTTDVVKVTSTGTTFVYGQTITKVMAEDKDALVAALGVKVSATGFADVSKYINITNVEIVGATYSTANYLAYRNDSYVVNVTLSSDEFTALGGKTVSFTITRATVSVDASTLISKPYDGNTSLPAVSWVLNGVVGSDDITIDQTGAAYASAEINDSISIVGLDKSGDDKDNYELSSSPVYGRIVGRELEFNIKQPSASFFVNDGETNPSDETFTVNYNGDSSALLNAINSKIKSRLGYTQSGFTYGSAVAVDASHIDGVLAAAITAGNAGLDLNAVWTIKKFSFAVNGAHASFTISMLAADGESFVVTTDTTFDYYTRLLVNITGAEGWKFAGATLNGETQAVSGANNRFGGQFAFNLPAQNSNATVNMEEILITVSINPGTTPYAQVSGNVETETLTYSDANSKPVVEILAERGIKATDYTYTLTGWKFSGKAEEDAQATEGELDLSADATKDAKLQDLELDIVTDVAVTFTAQWTADEYNVTFDPNGGSITDGSASSNVAYAGNITAFPSVEKEGMVALWNTKADGTGKWYDNKTIFVEQNAQHAVTLYAIWREGSFTFNLGRVDAKIASVKVNGKELVGEDVNEEDKTFTLMFGESLVFTVIPQAGYNFEANLTGAETGHADKDGNTITVYGISKAGVSLEISAVALDNTLAVNFIHASATGLVDGKVVAKTGTTASMTFTAENGYSFDNSSAISFTGSGEIEKTIAENHKSVTIVWKNFTAGASLSVNPSPVNNVVTVLESEKVATLTINGKNVQVSGGYTFSEATTDTTLTVVANLKYGYKLATLEITGANSGYVQTEGSETYDDVNKVYIYTFIISNFTQDFNIAVDATAREYEFSVRVQTPNEPDAATDCSANFTNASKTKYVYAENVALQANVASTKFRFLGWYIGDTLISEAGELSFSLNVNETLKNILESVIENEIQTAPVEIVAKFDYNAMDIEISTSAYGKATYTITGESPVVIEENSVANININMDSTLTIELKTRDGYKVKSVTFLDSVDQEITGKTWYNEETQTIEIKLNTAGVIIKSISIAFGADDASVTIKAGIEINSQVNYNNPSIAGKIFWWDNDAKTKKNDGDKEYTIASKTARKEYFMVELNGAQGYDFTLRAKTSGVIINRIDKETYDGTSMLFEVEGIIGEVKLEGIFTAKDNRISVYFAEKEGNSINRVYAGEISVANDPDGKVVVAGNDSADVRISALTGASVSMTIFTNFAYSFATEESALSYKASDGIELNVSTITNGSDIAEGFTQRVTITITNVGVGGSIEIYVTAKDYTINLYSDDGNTKVGEISGVHYDQTFDSQLALAGDIIPDTISGYTFQGYFTKQIGQGKQYISSQGQATNVWREYGYRWDGTRYVAEDNFHANSDTFDLYASWAFNKTRIYLDFIPDELKDTVVVASDDSDPKKIAIGDVVTSLSSQNSWTSVDNILYAEILAGEKITVRVYPFENYVFHHWEIWNEENPEDVEIASAFPENFTPPIGTIRIKAVYHTTYELIVYNHLLAQNDPDCGEVYIEQDNQRLPENIYDTQKAVTLVAVANKGYVFYGWYNLDAGDYLRDGQGNIVKGSPDGENTYKYTMGELQTRPLHLRADFEGISIQVKIDLSKFRMHGNATGVFVNGENAGGIEFNARVGDIITMNLTPDTGYGVKISPAFTGQGGTYTYKIVGSDLVGDDQNGYVLNIEVVADPQPVTYTFEVLANGDANSEAISLAGSLSHRNASGDSVKVENGTKITILYGDSVYIDTVVNSNHKIGTIYLRVGDQTYDISSYYVETQRQIVLSSELLTRYGVVGSARVTINFVRVLWTDVENRSTGFEQGDGTNENPYKITNEKDMAFLAYAVNSGLANEAGLKYSNAVYTVTKDLDFTGKYWIPIGTEANPFAGTINFGSHWFKGITLHTDYNPSTSYEGLIWYKTDAARVVRTGGNLGLILGIVGGAVGLIAIIILIILLVRHSKKKRREELANS